MRTAALLSAPVILALALPVLAATPSVTVNAAGTTNTFSSATVKFDLKDEGTLTLAATGALVALQIGDTKVDVSKNAELSSMNKGQSGSILANIVLPEGKVSVTITVKLSDGTTATGTADVTFKKPGPIICCPPSSSFSAE